MKFNDLSVIHQEDKKEFLEVFSKIIDNSSFINGYYVEQFEKDITEFLNVKYAIGVSSGTDSLLVPLMAHEIGLGDEVITTPFTFIATAEVIALTGAKPVFVDIDEKDYNIDVTKIEEKITDNTKAIIPVHLYGNPANMEEIMKIAKKYNLIVIEDAAQAIGAEINSKKVTGFGDYGSLSFFPAKNLGCLGDGGMITTNSEEFYKKCKIIKEHGQSERYVHKYLGINGRLDALQAAVLSIKLKKLNNWIEDRIRIVENYKQSFQNLDLILPTLKEGCKHVYNQFTIRCKNREKLIEFLNEKGVPTAIHYPIPLHFQEVFKNLGYKKGDFPVAEKVSSEVLSLPLYPGMPEEEQNLVINSVKSYFNS